MGMPIVEIESELEDVNEYVEEAKSILEGRDNSLSMSELESELTEDLETWEDREYHLVNQAMDQLEDDEDVSSYRPGGGNPLTKGAKQFYIK